MFKGYALYTLVDPRKPEAIRHIGFTNNPRLRLNAHICTRGRRADHRTNWVNKLLREGVKPQMSILCWVQSGDEAKRVEIELIARFKRRGCKLTNSSAGGDGIIAPEVREKIREANKKLWRGPGSDERRQRARERTLAIMTPELRARLSAHTSKNRLGLKHSEETKQRMKEAWARRREDNYSSPLKGQKRPPEVCLKISQARIGKPRSEETKRKVSETRKAKFSSGEYSHSYPQTGKGKYSTKKEVK